MKKFYFTAVSIIVLLFWLIPNFKCLDTKTDSIPIAMALDDNYLYPTIVAITSINETANKNTRYDFYIMHPPEFKESSKTRLLSLQEKHKNCTINLIDMKNQYKGAVASKGYITTPAYYRLSLQDLLPELDKIIWLDCDTLVFEDLTKMFDIDMQGYHYKGFLDYIYKDTERFGVYNDHYICSGVMLINLKELREDNITEKFQKFIKENSEKLGKTGQNDQLVINVVCSEKLGILPARYGIFNYNLDIIKKYPDRLISPNKYTKNEMIDAYNNPCVLHLTKGKPWKFPSATCIGGTSWWKYAEKTDFFDEI